MATDSRNRSAMRHVRRLVVASVVVLVGSLVHAFSFPPDSEFIVTDAQGVIVAIGRTVGGTSASVEVWSGFEGPARLTLFEGDGSTRAIDVAIADGVLAIEGVDLRLVLAAVFVDVAVRFVAEPGMPEDPPGVGPGREDDPGAEDHEAPGRDGEPPGQDRRPEEPPGQEQRPVEPPGQERRPEEPPGQERRPQDPPGPPDGAGPGDGRGR